MFTCLIRYTIDLQKIKEFEEYARVWIALVKKYGGVHQGYFLPEKDPDDFPEDTSFSFPNIGRCGPKDVAIALFSFPSVEKYEFYRKTVVDDEQCKRITAYHNDTKCFLSYERSFLNPMFPDQ
ncbi:MAG: hypothetical protein A2X77_03040 [Gammaproteobacteria bacterium GWE2_42_36]|nr:MAG: hypothetical protein A2X77_03040 [Gammaproteobacteria bacterium GWE2_42_36]